MLQGNRQGRVVQQGCLRDLRGGRLCKLVLGMTRLLQDDVLHYLWIHQMVCLVRWVANPLTVAAPCMFDCLRGKGGRCNT